MNVWKRLNSVWNRPERRGEQLIRAALRGWNMPQCEPTSGMWAVVAPPKDTYRTKVFLWADGDHVRCTATSDLCIDRGLLRRELLLQLLERNQPEDSGAFGLVSLMEDRLIVLDHWIDPRLTTPIHLRSTVERMLVRYQRMVTRLYSMELIMTGPEPFEPCPMPSAGNPAGRSRTD